MNENQRRVIRDAISIATVWLGGKEAQGDIACLIADIHEERGVTGLVELITGLTNVLGVLLIRISEGDEVRCRAILQDIALRYGGFRGDD